jgi:tetratricopeptide (TPR) repeat protein
LASFGALLGDPEGGAADAEDDALDRLVSALHDDPSNDMLRSLFEKARDAQLNARISSGFERISSNKHDIDAYLSVAIALSLESYPAGALEVLTNGVIENPNSVPLWLNIGVIELIRRRPAEALSVFREVMRLDPKNTNAMNNIAFVESSSNDPRLKNMQEALAFAEQAVKLEPSNANFIDTLADIHFKRGDKDEALRLLRQAIQIDPDEPLYKAKLDRLEKAD